MELISVGISLVCMLAYFYGCCAVCELINWLGERLKKYGVKRP